MSDREFPRVFRILLPARDLEDSRNFYEHLLNVPGRLVAPGRYYFGLGLVILGVLDYSGARQKEIVPPTEAVYIAVDDLESVHARASTLGCLSSGNLHEDPRQPLGSIVTRPWGERSFYAEDPTGNPLCIVASGTEFTGTPDQIETLRRAMTR